MGDGIPGVTADPREVRQMIRLGDWTGPTAGLAPGYAQANLVVLPKDLAFDFLLFCQRNRKACPLLDVMEPGDPVPGLVARGADIRTDVPKYRLYRRGVLESEFDDLRPVWSEEYVSFLLGCSFSFEDALVRSGIPVRHVELGRNVPMFITNRRCVPAGVFKGPLVVSMRPIPGDLVPEAVLITSRYPSVHGAPIAIGDPASLGIRDLEKPDFGDPVPIRANEVPVFWACGVTPQAVAMTARPELMITHAPGHMFITDIKNDDVEEVMTGVAGTVGGA